jgi:hypothetical protein
MVWEEVTDDEQGPSNDDSILVPSSYRPSKVKSPLQDRTNTTTANLGECEDGTCDDDTKQKSSKQTITDGVKDKRKSSTAVSSKGGKKTGAAVAAVVGSAVTTGKQQQQQQSMMSFFNKKA